VVQARSPSTSNNDGKNTCCWTATYVHGQVHRKSQLPDLPPCCNSALAAAEHRYGISAVAGDMTGSSLPAAIRENYNIAMVDGGESHALALLNDGSVIGWTNGKQDANKYGQATVPPFLPGRKAVQVAAGANFSVVLLDNGSLLAWGGDVQYGLVSVPEHLKAVKVTAVSAGFLHALVILENGTVAGFGSSLWGQLNIPEELLGEGANIVQVAGGGAHSLARTADGRVYAWGHDKYGQVSVPPAVQAGGVLHIAAGAVISFALLAGPDRSDPAGNKLVFWGGDSGQSDAQVLSRVVDFASGWRHIVTLQSTGVVRAFGFNRLGQVSSGNAFRKIRSVITRSNKAYVVQFAQPGSNLDQVES
jgi:alpha-tubulin suppressor-like RCC1 family protein